MIISKLRTFGGLLKRIIKKFFLKFLYLVYTILIRINSKDKKTLPNKYVYNLYEAFSSLERNGNRNKIAVPYVSISDFNRHDLNRPYEVLPATVLDSSSSQVINILESKKAILPIAILNNKETQDKPSNIDISYGNKNQRVTLKYKNRFHYLPIRNNKSFTKIIINSHKEKLAIGDPILDNLTSSNSRPKLILHIFVDAFSKIILDLCDEEIIPNTRNFFSNGKVFENVYSQGDWTLSSISGVFTGKYTKDHMIYHPRRGDKISSTTMAEALNDEGYFTSLISSIPKLTPLNGFDRGFKRSIIAPFKDANYIINEAIEQLDTINGNQYLFLGFFDIHEAYRLQPISSQIKNQLSDFNFKDIKKSKNLLILHDKERVAMYMSALKHFDAKLDRLYKKIDNYDKNATVVLHSDHGVDFITLNTQRLSKERQKVPLMVKGKGIALKDNNSIMEIREIPSMILNSIDAKEIFHYNNSGMAITESIYPNQEYELAIRDKKYVLFFQVPWLYVHKRASSEYEYKSSFHYANDELKQIEKNSRYNSMLDVARKHYSSLISNLTRFEDQ